MNVVNKFNITALMFASSSGKHNMNLKKFIAEDALKIFFSLA